MARRDDPLAVDRHRGHLAGPGSRRQNDVVGFVAGAVHVQVSRRRQPSESGDQVDVVLLEQKLHPLVHRLGHCARAGHHLIQRRAHFARQFHAVLFRGFAMGIDACAFQQRLGRDAAPVQTHAARFGPFHEPYPFAQLRRAYRRHIAARAAAHHQYVVLHRFVT